MNANRIFFSPCCQFFYDKLTLLFCPAITFFLSLLYKVQGRYRNVYITVFNKVAHIPEEEREDQRTNMASVDIRIRHNNNLMITELVQV